MLDVATCEAYKLLSKPNAVILASKLFVCQATPSFASTTKYNISFAFKA